VFLLNRQHVTRLDVVNYISHGLSKIAEEKTTDKEDPQSDGERDPEGGSALEKYTSNLNRIPGGPHRSADRAQAGSRTHHRNSVPPAQEQSVVCR